MCVRAIGVLALAATLGASSLAHGQDAAAEPTPLVVMLDYSAPPECPSLDEFKAVVASRLGYDGIRESAEHRVLVQITPRNHGFEGSIEWRDAEGRWLGDRTFPSRSDDCRELDRAMAFALALQIQLSMFAKRVDSPPAPEEAESPPPAPPPAPIVRQPEPPVAETVKPAAPEATAAIAIGAGGTVAFGLSSSLVPLVRLFAAIEWPHFSLELAGEAGWPTTTRRRSGAGFSQLPLLVSGAGCGIAHRWTACILAKAGEVFVTGKDIDTPASPSAPFAEAGLRLAFTQNLGRRAFVAARADGLVNLVLWKVMLDQEVVWTSPRFSAGLGIDAGMRFP